MAQKYYLRQGTETTGPFSLTELQGLRTSGMLTRTAEVFDGQRWAPAITFIEVAAADPNRVLEEAVALETPEEAEDAPVLTSARWESLLFILSFPVLLPSLILMFVLAKRWGHVDIYLIIVDGLILTVIGFATSPWLGALLLVSWIASVFLYWLRRHRQGDGIFLGYSNFISLLLIVGGSLTIGGFVVAFPWKAYGRWHTVRQSPLSVRVSLEQAADVTIPLERTIVFGQESLDFAHTIVRQKMNGEWSFVSGHPPGPLKFLPSGLRELWRDYQGYAGREVELLKVASAFGGVRNRVEIQEGTTKRTLDTPGLYFSLVSNSDGRIWIVRHGAPAAANSITSRGVARIIYNDATTANAFALTKRGGLPLTGLAIFEGEQVAAPPPESREAWVPIKNSRGAFWVRFPAGVTPTGDEPAAGIFTGRGDEFKGLSVVSAELFAHDAGRVLYQQSPAAYLAEQNISEQVRATITWKAGSWLAGGLALLGLAVWRAREE